MKYQSIIFFHNNSEIETDQIISSVAEAIGETIENFDRFNKIEVFTEENKIGIEEVKNLSEWNSMKTENKIKLAIIKQAEKLTTEAQNSILKIIEEPGENTLMILATNNYDSLLDTIKSRCLVINFKKSREDKQNELSKDFLKKDFLERSQILEGLSKESRVVIKEFIMNLLTETISNSNMEKEQVDRFCDILKTSYIGVDSGANIKLTLDNINIALL